MFIFSDFWLSLINGLDEFYQSDPILSIGIGIASAVFFLMFLIFCLTGLIQVVKRIAGCGRKGSYKISSSDMLSTLAKYETIPIDEFVYASRKSITPPPPPPPSPPPPPPASPKAVTRMKVIVIDEQPASIRVVKETEL
jgi:hypothetical protein